MNKRVREKIKIFIDKKFFTMDMKRGKKGSYVCGFCGYTITDHDSYCSECGFLRKGTR